MSVRSCGLSLPDRGRLVAYLQFLGAFYAFFLPVYLAGGWYGSFADRTYDLFFAWEKSIPIVPWTIWPYLSLYPLFGLPLFGLDANGMRRLTGQTVAVLAVAAVCFALFPGRLGYDEMDVNGVSGKVIELIRTVDTPHNLVPSLHVVFSWLILLAAAERASVPLKIIYGFWAVLMAASTLLVHRHHVADVAAGVALALVAQRFIRRPLFVAGR